MEKENILEIKDLYASAENKEILKGINITVKKGEIHALMGQNGSGKSTLGYVLTGHPKYRLEKGTITFNEKNLLELKPNERAKEGLFLAFQYPTEIQGVNYSHFLYSIVKARREINPIDFHKELAKALEKLNKDPSFVNRHINLGFSGGEKKVAEILQLMILKPKLAVMDETDSGLDVNALKLVADAINNEKKNNPEFSAVIITHYPKMLEYVKPDFVHVMHNGVIAVTGDFSLVNKIEKEGYKWLEEKNG